MKVLEIFGIERGYLGIIEEKIFPLSNRDVGGIITQGGTMLKNGTLSRISE